MEPTPTPAADQTLNNDSAGEEGTQAKPNVGDGDLAVPAGSDDSGGSSGKTDVSLATRVGTALGEAFLNQADADPETAASTISQSIAEEDDNMNILKTENIVASARQGVGWQSSSPPSLRSPDNIQTGQEPLITANGRIPT